MPYYDARAALHTCAYDDGLQATLRRNLGKTCTIHVPGEASPFGITGVLSEVGPSSCKLISIGCAPTRHGSDCEGARRIRTIPLDKITYIDTSQY